MASRSVPVHAIVPKAQTTPLTSPVSLLWAHQLRRENAALLERINELASSVSNVSTSHINKIAAQAKKAEEKSNKAAPELEKLRKAAQLERTKLETVEATTSSALAKTEASALKMRYLQDCMKELEERLENNLLLHFEKLACALEIKLNRPDDQVVQLHERMRHLEGRLSQFVKEGETIVRDSVGQLKEQMKPTANDRPKRRGEPSDALFAKVSTRSHAPRHIEENADQQMLTLHPQRPLRYNETPLGDIDLDEPTSPNQVDHRRHCDSDARGTMAMIPQLTPSQLYQHKDPNSLKQGKFQSLCNYMAAGQLFVDANPKRKESAVVDAFVDGIHSAEQKTRFETMLDEAGWIWDNVKALAQDAIAEKVDAQRQTQFSSPGYIRLEEGQTTTACGRTGPMLAVKNTVPKKARIPPLNQSRSKVAGTPPRRSQRIRQASKARTVDPVKDTAKSTQREPEAIFENQHVREKGEKSKRVTLITPSKMQHHNPTSIREKPIETIESTPCAQCNLHGPCTECASTDLTCTRPIDPPPQQGKETANGLLDQRRVRRASHHAEERHKEASGVIVGIAHQPQVDRPLQQPISKKRPRKCQMEVQKQAVDDLRTSMRQKTSETQPGSPMLKRRKRRKAASPIPMIPILPLTDEED